MSNCKNCGAALPPDSFVCSYCQTRQETDLNSIHRYTVEVPHSDRKCPRCNKPLQTIDIKLEGKFLIERCPDCKGLFFDPGELEAVLEKSVSHVYEIDYTRLDELVNARRSRDYPVTYIKCPVCQKLMNRINYGLLSGVIIDKCSAHGIWLDGGELRQLLEWTKSGGFIAHEKKQIEMERIKLQEDKDKLRREQLNTLNGPNFEGPFFGKKESAPEADDLLGKLTFILGRIF